MLQQIDQLIASKQLSIYLLLISLVVSAAMMHPGFATLMFAVPINAALLVAMRWAAHQEGNRFL